MPRIHRRCEYPLTAAAAVRRIYTDLAVIDVTGEGLVVSEIADDIAFAADFLRKQPAGFARSCRTRPGVRPSRQPVPVP